MQPFLSLLKNYTNPLGHKHAHACLHLVICSPECKSECCQIPIFLPGNLSSYPMLHLWASQHYWYLLTVLFIPRNSIHHWPGLGHPMEMCGWLHRCLLPVVCFLCNDNHKSNELMFILQITDPIRWQALKNIWVSEDSTTSSTHTLPIHNMKHRRACEHPDRVWMIQTAFWIKLYHHQVSRQ